MTAKFDPTDPAALEAALAELAEETAPLRPDFRARLVADAARVAAPAPAPRARWMDWLGLAGLPAAALAGAWIGLANPALVWQATPWDGAVAVEEEALLTDLFGGDWAAFADLDGEAIE